MSIKIYSDLELNTKLQRIQRIELNYEDKEKKYKSLNFVDRTFRFIGAFPARDIRRSFRVLIRPLSTHMIQAPQIWVKEESVWLYVYEFSSGHR